MTRRLVGHSYASGTSVYMTRYEPIEEDSREIPRLDGSRVERLARLMEESADQFSAELDGLGATPVPVPMDESE